MHRPKELNDQQSILDRDSLLPDGSVSPSERERIERLVQWNCVSPAAAAAFASEYGNDIVPQMQAGEANAAVAVIHLLAAVTPHNALQESLFSGSFEALSSVHVVSEQTDDGSVLNIHNIPTTLSPVRVKETFTQVSATSSTEMALVPAYHITMELGHNWYEAVVSATAPYKIWSVVDWSHDFWEDGLVFYDTKPTSWAAHPTDKNKPNQPKVDDADWATYHVFQFGINDPSVPPALNLTGNHTLDGRQVQFEEKLADSMASPLGWHRVPSEVAYPYPIGGNSVPRDYGRKVETTNYTVTAGNNVSLFVLFKSSL